MKDKIQTLFWKIFGVVFIAVCLVGICHKDIVTIWESMQAKKAVKTWISEEFNEAENVQCSVRLSFSLPYRQGYSWSDYEGNYILWATFDVETDKVNNIVRFENIYLNYRLEVDGKSYKEIKEPYYLKIEGSGVCLYIPENDTYTVRVITDSRIESAVEYLFFSENKELFDIKEAEIYAGEDYVTDYHYRLNGIIDAHLIYEAFCEELPHTTNIQIDTELRRGDYYPEGDARFIVYASDIKEIFYGIAGVLNENEWINPIDGEQIKLETRITVTFPVNFDENTEIEVPNIGM